MLRMFKISETHHPVVGTLRCDVCGHRSAMSLPIFRLLRSGEKVAAGRMRCALLLLLLLLTPALAVEPGPEILLWPKGAPGSEGKTNLDTIVRIADNGERVLSNIHKPSITPYLPSVAKATGCAVIVAPGGGHRATRLNLCVL